MIISDYNQTVYTGFINKLAIQNINDQVRFEIHKIADKVADDIISKIDIKKMIIESIPQSDGGENYVISISITKPKDAEQKPQLPLTETTIPRIIVHSLMRHGIMSWEMLLAEVKKNGYVYIEKFNRIGPKSIGILAKIIRSNDPKLSW